MDRRPDDPMAHHRRYPKLMELDGSRLEMNRSSPQSPSDTPLMRSHQ